MFLGRMDGQIPVKMRADADVEGAGELALGERLRNRLVIGGHVLDTLSDQPLEAVDGIVAGLGQPGQRRELEASGDILAVLGGPRPSRGRRSGRRRHVTAARCPSHRLLLGDRREPPAHLVRRISVATRC